MCWTWTAPVPLIAFHCGSLHHRPFSLANCFLPQEHGSQESSLESFFLKKKSLSFFFLENTRGYADIWVTDRGSYNKQCLLHQVAVIQPAPGALKVWVRQRAAGTNTLNTYVRLCVYIYLSPLALYLSHSLSFCSLSLPTILQFSIFSSLSLFLFGACFRPRFFYLLLWSRKLLPAKIISVLTFVFSSNRTHVHMHKYTSTWTVIIDTYICIYCTDSKHSHVRESGSYMTWGSTFPCDWHCIRCEYVREFERVSLAALAAKSAASSAKANAAASDNAAKISGFTSSPLTESQ